MTNRLIALVALVIVSLALILPLMAQVNATQGTLAAADSGTCATTYSRLTLKDNDATASITLTGTFAGTVSFVGSADYGRSWAPMAGVSWATPTSQPATTSSQAGGFTFDVVGKTHVCAYVSAYASGTVVVAMASQPVRSSSLLSPNSASLFGANSLGQSVMADARGLRVSTFNDPFVLPNTVVVRTVTASAAVATQTTLTVPKPAPGLYNYVCALQFVASQDGTATAIDQAVTTSTNFNSFALQFSAEDVAEKSFQQTFNFVTPVGCAKSDLPGTTTTFVSPTGVTNASFAWQASFYQAP